jgi:F0F1-type ATP synthase delta subunit
MRHLQQMQAMFDQLFDADQAKPSHDLARLLPSDWLSESVKKSVAESVENSVENSVSNRLKKSVDNHA